VLDHLDCLWVAPRHKSSLVRTTKLRKWTKEEDKKLMELYEQAVREKRPRVNFIANELGDRTVSAVMARLYVGRHKAVERRSNRRWSVDEDSTIREKLQQGIPMAQLPKYLPSRSLNAIRVRLDHLRTVAGTTPREEFTSVHVQRAIHMRLREQKSRAEAAAELNCHLSDFQNLWKRHCAPCLSKDDLDSLHARTHWTHDETNRLTEIYTWTTLPVRDVALQFPSKTRTAVSTKIKRLQLQSARKERQAALADEASGSTPVAMPVTHQTPRQTLGEFGQRRMFSSSTCRFSASRFWNADEHRKLLELKQQGMKHAEIAKVLGGRTVRSVTHRLASLRVGPSTKKSAWTPSEDAMILEKVRQGLKSWEISQYVPGRGLYAIAQRGRQLRLKKGDVIHSGDLGPFTSADIQVMIEMRLNERKTLRGVAVYLGRSYMRIQRAWERRCRPLLSEEALRSIHAASRNLWTTNESDRLVELYNQGKLTVKEIALQFPSRTYWAVESKLWKAAESLDKSRKGTTPSSIRKLANASSRQSREASSPRGLQPTRPTLSMPDSIGSTSRREFSSSSRASFGSKFHVWIDDEDQKILELERRGMSRSYIAERLGRDFTKSMVRGRLYTLEAGTSSGTNWRPEEIAMLMKKRQEGLSFNEIAAHLPGRTKQAVSSQYRNRSIAGPLSTKERKAWTEADLRRVIEMRVKERRSIADIAAYLGRSPEAVSTAWKRLCTKLVPKETMQKLYYNHRWKPAEEERLIHLREQGLTHSDIALQFPSRTPVSVSEKLKQLTPRIASQARTSTFSKFDWIALKTALEPYLDMKKHTSLTRIHAAFPQFSRYQITTTLHLMRSKRERGFKTEQSDNGSVRVKDEGKE